MKQNYIHPSWKLICYKFSIFRWYLDLHARHSAGRLIIKRQSVKVHVLFLSRTYICDIKKIWCCWCTCHALSMLSSSPQSLIELLLSHVRSCWWTFWRVVDIYEVVMIASVKLLISPRSDNANMMTAGQRKWQTNNIEVQLFVQYNEIFFQNSDIVCHLTLISTNHDIIPNRPPKTAGRSFFGR